MKPPGGKKRKAEETVVEQKRGKLLNQVWNLQNEAYDLMCEYDAMPHRYGECMLYQAEAHMIDLIALYPGITAADLAKVLRKTPSACSQTLRKLREKGLVEQLRAGAVSGPLRLQRRLPAAHLRPDGGIHRGGADALSAGTKAHQRGLRRRCAPQPGAFYLNR